jgi:hypothetical protein
MPIDFAAKLDALRATPGVQSRIITPTGRTTVSVPMMNEGRRVQLRAELIARGGVLKRRTSDRRTYLRVELQPGTGTPSGMGLTQPFLLLRLTAHFPCAKRIRATTRFKGHPEKRWAFFEIAHSSRHAVISLQHNNLRHDG